MMVLKEIQTLLMSHIEIYTAWLLTPVSLRTSVLPFTLRPGEATPTGSGDPESGLSRVLCFQGCRHGSGWGRMGG